MTAEGLCLFSDLGQVSVDDEIGTMGLFSSGEYLSSKRLTNKTSESDVRTNGTGQMILWAGTEGENRSEKSREYSAGEMHIGESIVFGR